MTLAGSSWIVSQSLQKLNLSKSQDGVNGGSPHKGPVMLSSGPLYFVSTYQPLKNRFDTPWNSCFIQYYARIWPWYSLRGLHIHITWFSLYGIRITLFSLYDIHMPLLPYMVIQPIVLGMALLWAAMDSSLSQGPLLWRHNDIRYCFTEYARTWARHPTTRMHGDYRPSIDRFFVGFNAICYAFLRNNPIYIEGRNCSFITVPVLFNKCSGLRPSDTSSSWRLGWRRHARVGKPFFGKSLDL